MNAFAACIRRETWVLVVQAVPFSSGRSGCSCTKESHPAHVGGNQCEGGYTHLSKESEVKSPDKSPRGTNSGRAWLGPETPPYALQSQPCDLIDTIDLMDTARLVRCISSTIHAKVCHLSIRLFRVLGYAANREEEKHASKTRQSAPRVCTRRSARRNRTTFEHLPDCHRSQCQPNTAGL
jgi:hypothetical protein